MITRSDDYVEYCRETAKHLRDVQDLALRGKNKQEITRLIQERIVRELDLRPGDDVVDVGCGDGTLLTMATRAGVRSAIGLLATEEEAAIVRRLGLRVQPGLTDRLPLPDQSASVVVCNNVLLVVPRERIPASVREICRIARPEARVFLGEIPVGPGPIPMPQFTGARAALDYIYRKQGLRAWLGMWRRMAYSKITGQAMIIRDGAAIAFYAEPPEFIAMAQAAGLELVRYWQHEYPAGRYNYLFKKGQSPASAASTGAEA
jgi:SAM-dependent methyltransferase